MIPEFVASVVLGIVVLAGLAFGEHVVEALSSLHTEDSLTEWNSR